MILDVLRIASVRTTLPEGELVFYSMTGREALGVPYRYDLQLLSENADIGLSELLGQPISVSLEVPDDQVREFNGIVTDFAFAETIGRHSCYHVTVRPWLWLLSQRVQSRIYQNQMVPEVLEAVFREHGFSDFENALTETYRRLEYLVQYRESDLHFVSRLMELEGIYFYFKHEDGIHKLVLADSYSAHEAKTGYESVPYYPPTDNARRERDHVHRWLVRRTLCPAAYSTTDFNFTRPITPVKAQTQAPLDHAFNTYEVYDHPGAFVDEGEAEAQARVRLEELQADFEHVLGGSNARGLACGGLFKLTQYPRADQNAEYLIVNTEYRVSVGDYDSTENGAELEFHVDFLAIESSRPYRAPRVTRKPVVEGPQTATVVGQDGQEIWTDEYGRVRLHFHWDREGPANEGSSCWVRVSQAWAGMDWGSIHIPRIGHEVIVSFLEGDPDRPIVTGRVYNAANMPPYALPDNQTQSGIKSRSSKDATAENFNEIRFEDKKGQEELFMQAEKNMTVKVKQNHSISAGASQSLSAGGDQSISTQANQTVTVKGTRSLTVKGGESKHDVTGKYALTASDTIDITATNKITLKCGGSTIVMTPADITLTSGGKATIVLDPDITATSAKKSVLKLDADAACTASTGASMKLTSDVVAASKGGSTVTLDANAAVNTGGSATIDGKTVACTGKTEASIAAGGSLQLSAASADLSGAQVNVTGQGVVSIGGPMVKIG